MPIIQSTIENSKKREAVPIAFKDDGVNIRTSEHQEEYKANVLRTVLLFYALDPLRWCVLNSDVDLLRNDGHVSVNIARLSLPHVVSLSWHMNLQEKMQSGVKPSRMPPLILLIPPH